MLKILLFISVFFVGTAYIFGDSRVISQEKEKAIHLLLYDEQIVNALRVFTNEIRTSTKQRSLAESADNIYWIAECLFQLKKINALDTLLIKCEAFTKQHNQAAYLKLKTLEAKCLIEKGKYNESIFLLTKLPDQTKNNPILCEIELTLADANQRKQLLDKSREEYQFVIKNGTDTTQVARAYNGLGSYYSVLSRLDSAKTSYDIAYNKFYNHLGEQHSRTAQVLYNLGLVADRNFDLFIAEQHFLKALSIYQKRLGDLHPRTAETYGALGSLFLMKDNPGKALFYSLKEQDILLQLYGKENPDLAYSYLNCGKIYDLLNEQNKSEEQLKLAIELVKKHFGTTHNLYSQCIVELSKIYTERKTYDTAAKILTEAILQKKQHPDDYLADIYLQLGENYLWQEQYEMAFDQFNKARSLYLQYYGERSTYLVDPLLGISNVYLKQKRTQDAIAVANSALSITKEKQQIIYPYDYWLCMVQAIKCKQLLNETNLQSNQTVINDIELIKATLRKAIEIKNTLYTAGSQLYYSEKMAELNQLGIYYLTHFYKKTDSYFLDNLLFFAENNKANLLRNKIVNYKADEMLPLTEKSKSSAITGKLNYFNSLNENMITTSFNINDSILFYQNQYEAFTKSIENKYPKIYTLKYKSKQLSVREIQNKLTEDETFLEYCNDASTYYCLAISKNNITYKICGNKNKIDVLVDSFLTSILYKKTDDKQSNQLYQNLLPKKLNENLLISADASLLQLSFDALKNNSSDYLINEHPIQYAFSANTYFNHQPIIKNKNVIAFYPDFTNSSYAVLNNKKEHEALKLFSNYSVYHKQLAIKENFISQCNAAGIIHIASHLITDTIAPLQSFLVFQPNNNYMLSINDIWKLNTNCQLITLASCQSNFGKQQNGEGIQNFAWAFHYAGARNILSTQWNASDKSTAAIVSDFYKNLRNGKSKAKALQLAKINYLRQTDAVGAQPFFWSNFFLYGDESPVKISPHFLVKLWWIPVLLLLLCYLAIAIYNKLYRKKQYEHL